MACGDLGYDSHAIKIRHSQQILEKRGVCQKSYGEY